MNKRCATGKVHLNIAKSECYKCKKLMNVAWCSNDYDDGGFGECYGPESFDDEMITIAEKNDVIIKEAYSKQMEESYKANICPFCGAFIGKIFIHDYFYSQDKQIEIKSFDEDEYTNRTVDFYDNNALIYHQNTATIDFEERQNMLLKYLSPGAHILDLGCGSGRDSKAFIQKGYIVTAMDGSSELSKLASKFIGQKVICRRFQDINNREKFDAVWACASLLHIESKNLQSVIFNILKSLKVNGYFYSSFKYGDFEGEKNGRYFTDLTENSFKLLLEPFDDLEIIELTVTSDVRSGHEDEKWLNVIIKKC